MVKTIQEIINNDSKLRLDRFISNQIDDISRTKIQLLINAGQIKVDNFIVKPSYKLKGGESISLNTQFDKNDSQSLLKQKIPLEIIFEDEELIVVNKPSGLVVHPGSGNPDGTLLNGLLYYFDKLSSIDKSRPGIIHRLDKYTSGIIIVAKTDRAHYFLSEQFAKREIKKVYRAIVWGKMNNEGVIKGNIVRDKYKRTIFKLSASKGKSSYSSFKLLKQVGLFSYIEVYPVTGRTHQIRVHMHSIGHPIILDENYSGGKENLKGYHSNLKKMADNVFTNINRYALHAYSIEFIHPITKDRLTFKVDIPDDMANCIKIMDDYINE